MKKHLFTYLVSQGIPALIGFLSLMLYSRILSPVSYGLYSFIMIIPLLINTVLFEWIRLSFLRYYDNFKEDKSKLITTVIITFIVMSNVGFIVVLFLYIFLNDLFNDLSFNLIFLGLVIGWFQAIYGLNITFYRVKLKSMKYAIITVLRSITMLLLSIVLVIVLDLNFVGLLLSVAFGFIITFIFIDFRFWVRNFKFNYFSRDILLELAKYGLPVSITFALGFILSSTDKIMIRYFMDEESLGLYTLSFEFTEQTIILLMSVVNLATYPVIIKFYEQGDFESTKLELEKNITYLLLIAIPAVLGFFFVSKDISKLLFGEAFSSVGTLMPFIAVGTFLKGIKLYYADIIFQLTRNTYLQFYPLILAAILNLVLNYLLIPLYGLSGAVFSSIIAYVASFIYALYLGQKILKVKFPKKNFFFIVVSSLLMIVYLAFSKSYDISLTMLIFKILISVIIYFTTYYLMGSLTKMRESRRC